MGQFIGLALVSAPDRVYARLMEANTATTAPVHTRTKAPEQRLAAIERTIRLELNLLPGNSGEAIRTAIRRLAELIALGERTRHLALHAAASVADVEAIERATSRARRELRTACEERAKRLGRL
jgi:hypothetical protein